MSIALESVNFKSVHFVFYRYLSVFYNEEDLVAIYTVAGLISITEFDASENNQKDN